MWVCECASAFSIRSCWRAPREKKRRGERAAVYDYTREIMRVFAEILLSPAADESQFNLFLEIVLHVFLHSLLC